MNRITDHLNTLKEHGNYRSLRDDMTHSGLTDLASNDYLGLAGNENLRNRFFSFLEGTDASLASSASRLLSLHQRPYSDLEQYLGKLYNGRHALLFNSGYHANSGIIPAICNKDTLIVCDRLVHASIIDGIILSRAKFIRFKHNNLEDLQRIIESNRTRHEDILVITESVFSMDGDICDLPRLVELKKAYPEVRLYVDEAHGFGVFGKQGLGICEQYGLIDDIDVIIGTLGKAAASIGAFAITDYDVKELLVNTARSFIFSTMLPPFNCQWSQFAIKHIIGMEAERKHLLDISHTLNDFFLSAGFETDSRSQIVPLIVRSAEKATALSQELLNLGYIALPIRTPTVPAGTERIRFSLNSSLSNTTIDKLIDTLKRLL